MFPFQNQLAGSLLSHVDINSLAHEAIAKIDSKQLMQMLVDSFKAEITHLQAQDPSHPGQTYLDEAIARVGTIEQEGSALLEIFKSAHAI